jgi:XTP/dITP diphosphohydrolase
MLDRPIILATRNKGKIKEFEALLAGFGVEFQSLNDFGPVSEVVEDGSTFEENAYKKASQTARMLGFPALADDSGLVVEALDGAPGVRSARYAGDGVSDDENNRRLLEAMEGRDDRRAAFECVISIAVPRGPALTYEARCEGEIARRPAGTNGFGYDPIFFYPPLGKTFAELTAEEKNRISHRGKAMAELGREFDKVLLWLEQRLREEPF